VLPIASIARQQSTTGNSVITTWLSIQACRK
jgi:hypothetical protein